MSEEAMFRADYAYEEVTTSGKEGILFYGHKGSGKTSAAYLLPGKKVVLSYDGKSLRAKEMLRPDDKDIVVLDARKYMSHLKSKMTEGGKRTIEYSVWLLEEVNKRGGCDWVVIDGLDILLEAAEMAMRYDHKVGPLDPFANLGWWKDRKLNLRLVYDTAFRVARKGVVNTTYVDKDDIVNNATLVRRTDVPRWMDIVMYDTDAVVRTQIDVVDGKQRFRLYVVSSKIKRFATGDVLDVTYARTLDEAVRVGTEEVVDLNKAIQRKKARARVVACPECGSAVVTEMSILHCTQCDWVHEDDAD